MLKKLGKAQIAYNKAVTWYEDWAEKYNRALECTSLQTSHWGNKSLAQFFGWFEPYEDTPDVTARLTAKKLRVVSYLDLDRNAPRLTHEELHKKAMTRLRKIEKKLAEWHAKVDDAKLRR